MPRPGRRSLDARRHPADVRRTAFVGLTAVWLCVGPVPALAQDTQVAAEVEPRDLTELSLDDLAGLKVTTVSRKPEAWGKTAAAIYVITADDIRRSGARTIPELLRYVPGVDVARNSSSQWGIGIRGFTSSLARAQLVLIDGRSVYSPLFAGTYWDVQNVPLREIERIEVIRGPGGTLWGANAVNGVINIITRDSTDTHGGRVTLGAGDKENGFGVFAQGGRLGRRGSYRVYARYFDRDPEAHVDTGDFDGWHMAQAGFRADWEWGSKQALVVQGDLYGGREGQRSTIATYTPPYSRTVEQQAKLGGGDLRARFNRAFGNGSELTLRAYYDATRRHEANFREDRDTFDFDGQYRRALGGRNELVAGAGYRLSTGRARGSEAVRLLPPTRTDGIFTAFVEDQLQLVPERVTLSVGTKVERNDYTGFEFQPGLRLGFEIGARHFAWLAATRAVRTPSRIERDLLLDSSASQVAPLFIRLQGSATFSSERVLALQAGYRGRLSDLVQLDLAVFRNRFDDLSSLEPGAAPFLESGRVIVPLAWGNGLEGTVLGLELAARVRPTAAWSVRSGYGYLSMALETKPESRDTFSEAAEGANPRHSLFLWSSHTLPHGLLLDGWLRWVDGRTSRAVRAYTELDLRAAWRGEHLELAGVGRNLLKPRHLELAGGALIERSFFLEATWRW